MKYTPEEVAELLKERPNQPHYIRALIGKCVRAAVLAEQEACIDIVAFHGGSVEIEAAIRARSNP